MLKKALASVATMFVLMALVGCAENKLTRENYDLVKKGMSTKLEVEETLGKPNRVLDDQWEYEHSDPNNHLTVYIHWDENGKVLRKEWIDPDNNVWEGAAPGIDEDPEGRTAAERGSSTTVTKP